MNNKVTSHRANMWQIALFSLNTASHNLYLALMGYVSYYISGIAGLTVMLVSLILTSMHLFDGITDPIVGLFIDKTQGRFGKFRPYIFFGFILMAASSIILFLTCHKVPFVIRIPYFILIYGIYIIGYTFQTSVSKSGQVILTNSPKQRPLTTLFDSVYTMAAHGFTALYVSVYLIPKYKNFDNPELFKEFTLVIVAITAVCSALSIIGIRTKDKPLPVINIDSHIARIKFKDYIEIILHNKPLRFLMVAASSNKFASMIYGHSAVIVIIFGIMMNNYPLAGLIGIITAPATLLIIFIGISLAKKYGQREILKKSCCMAVIVQLVMLIMFIFMDCSSKTFMYCFIVIFAVLNGFKSISNNIVVPMIADCTDYEYHRSGRFVPGIMGAAFSFIDKSISALGTAFVGIVMTLIGFKDVFPQVDTPISPSLKWAGILLYCIVPMLGWCATLISMHFYKLDKKALEKLYTD